MQSGAARHCKKTCSNKPLVVRAGLSRTFGSLAGFAALTFLSLGIYLLADAFAHPVDAQAAALIVAAFSIALAALLLFYLFKPQRIAGVHFQEAFENSGSDENAAGSNAATVLARRASVRKDLAYQRAYVDHSRIRP